MSNTTAIAAAFSVLIIMTNCQREPAASSTPAAHIPPALTLSEMDLPTRHKTLQRLIVASGRQCDQVTESRRSGQLQGDREIWIAHCPGDGDWALAVRDDDEKVVPVLSCDVIDCSR